MFRHLQPSSPYVTSSWVQPSREKTVLFFTMATYICLIELRSPTFGSVFPSGGCIGTDPVVCGLSTDWVHSIRLSPNRSDRRETVDVACPGAMSLCFAAKVWSNSCRRPEAGAPSRCSFDNRLGQAQNALGPPNSRIDLAHSGSLGAGNSRSRLLQQLLLLSGPHKAVAPKHILGTMDCSEV